jgi:glycosidase
LLLFLLGGCGHKDGSGEGFRETVETLREHYPPFAFHNAMNFLGTHDTPRILTLLGVGGNGKDRPRSWRRDHRLTAEEFERGLARLRLGLLILFTFPGAPTLYYGDEAGMEGFEDPWNRRSYPWGRENQALLEYCRKLGQYRRSSLPLRQGDLVWGSCTGRTLSFRRGWEGSYAAAAVNAGNHSAKLTLPWPQEAGPAFDLFTGTQYEPESDTLCLALTGMTGVLLVTR